MARDKYMDVWLVTVLADEFCGAGNESHKVHGLIPTYAAAS